MRPAPNSSFAPSLGRVAQTAAALALCGLMSGCGSGLVTSLPSGSGPSSPAVAVPKGPQLGYGWKADDRTLRPILGIPGSSQVGESVVPGAAYTAGAASAASGWALLVGEDGTVYRMAVPSGTATGLGITFSGNGIRIRFSPSGMDAVLFVPGSTVAVAVQDIGATPSARRIAAPAALTDLTISDAGMVVAAVPGAVAVLPQSGGAQRVLTLAGAGSLCFAGSSDNLLVADAGANTLTLVRAVSSAPVPQAEASAGLLKVPAGVGISTDGRWAVAANGGESSVVRVDLTGASAPVRLPVSAQPTTVEPMQGNGVFRFEEVVAGFPVWYMDAAAVSPQVLFVPALPAPVPTSANPGGSR